MAHELPDGGFSKTFSSKTTLDKLAKRLVCMRACVGGSETAWPNHFAHMTLCWCTRQKAFCSPAPHSAHCDTGTGLCGWVGAHASVCVSPDTLLTHSSTSGHLAKKIDTKHMTEYDCRRQEWDLRGPNIDFEFILVQPDQTSHPHTV